ncbi:hypothetical protein EZV62_006113 [Acer yangbiense]|uniref:Uncharacterized protein n=1 Tax=Acer yangbiense TaxID=1000413 RepID=A0A5C7IQ16_9ROSI|nr:hypothetical protein EZV62_006113 [Acer yangbiense]
MTTEEPVIKTVKSAEISIHSLLLYHLGASFPLLIMSRAALSLKEGNWPRYGGEITKKDIVESITFVLWIISVSLDPYICYVPSIDDEKKLLKLNSSLMITIWVLLYSLVLIPKMEIRAPVFSVLLAIFLVVYLVRIIGIYRLFTRSTSRKLAEYPFTSIIKIAFNLLLFLYGGHLFGGLWYLFAIWKQLACWRNVCLKQDHQICHYANNRFNVNPEGNKLLSDTCFAKIEDTYELGIFKDAFESRIVEETSGLGKKLFYCFRWGLQNISGFGTNLQVSNYTWENIFVVLITVYGVGTFTYFIGNMQNVINSAIDERRRKADQEIKQQLQQWFTFGKLSENLQNCIKQQLHQYNGQQTGVVDVKNLFRNLPEDVRNKFKHELCFELKKKVKRFQRWSDAFLLHLCYCIKPVVYAERTCIVREGDPINEMLFVLHGKLWNFSSAASSTNNVPTLDRRTEILKDGNSPSDRYGSCMINKWIDRGLLPAVIESDAKSVVDIAGSGICHCADIGVVVSDIITSILSQFLISIVWVPRVAHALVKLALNVDGHFVWIESCPTVLSNIFFWGYPSLVVLAFD